VGRFVLIHAHEPGECRRVFAAWRGFESPLRHSVALASCEHGEHRIWWTVEADSKQAALAMLPEFVAKRTDAARVTEVVLP